MRVFPLVLTVLQRLAPRFFRFALLVLLFAVPVVHSQAGGISSGGGITNPVGCATIDACIESAVRYVLGIAGILALAGIVYGGFLYITAAANQDRIEAGKNAVTYSVIGLVVIGLAYAIITFIFQALGGGGGGSVINPGSGSVITPGSGTVINP